MKKFFNCVSENFRISIRVNDDTSENHFNIRLAVSVAAVYANPKNSSTFLTEMIIQYGVRIKQKEDPVKRYATYKELSKNGGYMDQLSQCSSPERNNIGGKCCLVWKTV